MLPELRLLPHEADDLAPDQPLCAPADWRVKTRLFGGEYLARAVAFQTDWRGVVARQQGQGGAPLLRLNIQNEAATDHLIANDLHHAQFERRLVFNRAGRLIAAPGEAHSVLHINFMGETFWISDGQSEAFRFVWRDLESKDGFDEKWRMNTPDAQIAGEIAQMLADETSDCAFAWTWLHRSHGERNAVLYRVARGSTDEIEALLRGAFWLGGENAPDEPCELVVDVGVGAGTEFYAGGAREIAQRSRLHTPSGGAPLSARQELTIEIVLRHFELWRNWDAQNYTVVREWWNDYDCGWTIAVPPPTAHQQLEGLMQLRDWLQGKVSSTELSELMPR